MVQIPNSRPWHYLIGVDAKNGQHHFDKPLQNCSCCLSASVCLDMLRHTNTCIEVTVYIVRISQSKFALLFPFFVCVPNILTNYT